MNYREAVDSLYDAGNRWDVACSAEPLSEKIILTQLTSEILLALETINRSFNGRKPLEVESDIPKQIDRDLCESIVRIINGANNRALRELSQPADDGHRAAIALLDCALRIGKAWEALLNGEVGLP